MEEVFLMEIIRKTDEYSAKQKTPPGVFYFGINL